ncbi:ATP-binding protein [Fibrella sp. HMF5335]|uniref:ATP-binding protein n=2 Tax=Fibrella rubiginis TaxID=2817060 RepID=A0A939GI32_9BACT|nr:ATP-binding protein [Fibrella rubiginis]
MVGRSTTDYKMLKELVRRGEGHCLEFKLKTNHPDKIVREIVAFANTDGGTLLIGVGDDGTIPGLKYADEDEYILVRAIEKFCFPAIAYTLERVQLHDEREVLVFRIPRSPHRPHYVMPDPTDPENKKVYVRVDDKSVQASKEVREIMKGERADRNVRFTYGDKEKVLMQHLDKNTHVTVDSFALLANIPRKIASRTLVLLVLANVLDVFPSDVMDRYTTKQMR